jgi:signal transduction histidine kinase
MARIDIARVWRMPGGASAVRWLLLAAIVPAMIVLVGRGLERVWLGGPSVASAAQRVATVQQKLEHRYGALFQELSAATETVARRSDLVGNASDSASGKALFALASSLSNRLDGGTDQVSLTIYNEHEQPIAWAGHSSGRPDLPRLSPGFRVVDGPLDVRLVHVAAIMDGGTRVGTVAAEHVLASGGGIQSRYLENFDLTVTTSGLLVNVTYVTAEASGHPLRTGDSSFVIGDPSGRPVVHVTVPPRAFEPARESFRRGIRMLATLGGLAGIVGLAFTVALASEASRILRVLIVVALLWLLRLLVLWTDVLAAFGWVRNISSREQAFWPFGSLLRSPVDVALTGAAVLGTAFAVSMAFEWARRAFRNRRLALSWTIRDIGLYALIHIALAWLALAMLIGYQRFIAVTVATGTIDVLYFSFHPWSSARLALQIGLVGFHTAAALILVLVFRAGFFITRTPARRRSWLPMQVGLWIVAVAIVLPFAFRVVHVPVWPSMIVYGSVAMTAYFADRLIARVRRRSASVRLAALFLTVLLPPLLFFASTAHNAMDHKRRVVDAQLARQVLTHREAHMAAFRRALTQIDALDAGRAVVTARQAGDVQALAFRLWMQTELGALRLTSAIEIADESGDLLSRFALKLPSYRPQRPLRVAGGTAWQVTEESATFAAITQGVMSANRSVYVDGRRVATVVVRVAHDYGTLPFISSQNPYTEVFRSSTPADVDRTLTDDVALAVYDWQRRPVYASTRPAWTLDERLLQRIRQDPTPLWTTLSRSASLDDVFVFWDAHQIYALGYAHRSVRASAVDVAELVVLVGVLYVAGLLIVIVGASASGHRTAWPMELPGEVRTSFYGKLLLTVMAAATVPMVVLSVSVHAQFEAHVRTEEEAEARTHVTAARRVVEDYEASGRSTLVNDDDVMVWIRTLVEQDVSVFTGGTLRATSQRDLFAAGLLPSLAPEAAYQTIAFERADEYVGREQIGSFGYMVAAAPVRFDGQDGILVIPLALRQREIDSKMNELDRGLLLLTLLVVLAAGALGYWRAERLATPIGRLTRATRRLARGEFHALPVSSPGDEVQRLIEAFNRMAADLERQRVRLEQTTRLEASAEMARRVAHDIKNPLTPVQLSAEHLMRVAADAGAVPREIVERCAENVLRQVQTLRQIATEFSNFGTAPEPHPEAWDVSGVLRDIAASYQSGLDGRVEFVVDVSADVPPAFADRMLVARALTNVVENALHAMSDRGRIVLSGRLASNGQVALDVRDTGSGIAPDVLSRIFEPYFSTRTGGTGLGMAIVKRNVEANGGTVEVTSTPGVGTCVTFVLPAASG